MLNLFSLLRLSLHYGRLHVLLSNTDSREICHRPSVVLWLHWNSLRQSRPLAHAVHLPQSPLSQKSNPTTIGVEEQHENSTYSRSHLTQHLEIINIKRRRIRIKELGLLIIRIRERMRTPRGHSHVITQVSNDGVPVETVELHLALCDEESLIVHLVPVGWGPGCTWGEGEFCRADAVVGVFA